MRQYRVPGVGIGIGVGVGVEEQRWLSGDCAALTTLAVIELASSILASHLSVSF
jgi:hypothetical protein